MTRYRKSKGAWGAVFNFSFAAALVAAFIPYIILGGSVGIVVLIVSACVSALCSILWGNIKCSGWAVLSCQQPRSWGWPPLFWLQTFWDKGEKE